MARNNLLKGIILHRQHYLFIAPMMILFAVFTIWPIIGSWYYSFFEWDGYGTPEHYVGFRNFVEVLTDPYFWNAFKNSFIFAFAHLLIELPIALLLAVILNNVMLKGRNIYRLLIFLPVVTATAVVGVVFKVLLEPVGGPVNDAMLGIGLISEPVNFLGSPVNALPTVIAVSIWKSVGTSLIYWLAGLQTIPAELYEAAKIDGASGSQQFFRITVPLLVPIGVIIMLLTFVNSLNPFDIVQTMTAGGPTHASDAKQTYIYRYAFNPEGSIPRYGFASAAGIVFGIAVLAITVVQSALLNKIKPQKAKVTSGE